MHRLVAYFIKSVHQNVILSQNRLCQNKVKFSNDKAKIIFLGRDKNGTSYESTDLSQSRATNPLS